MTEIEFRNQYERLRQRHPMHFNSQEMFDTTWEYVRDLSPDWFRRLVDRIILAPDPRHQRFDIADAASSERRNRKSVEYTNSVARASEALRAHMTANGLEENLKRFKANSLLDIIENQKWKTSS